jgi:hypothetical protein
MQSAPNSDRLFRCLIYSQYRPNRTDGLICSQFRCSYRPVSRLAVRARELLKEPEVVATIYPFQLADALDRLCPWSTAWAGGVTLVDWGSLQGATSFATFLVFERQRHEIWCKSIAFQIANHSTNNRPLAIFRSTFCN